MKYQIDNKHYLIVLTACINPSNESRFSVRMDLNLRLQDYRRALRFWLLHPDPRLRNMLFIDNSGFDLSTLIDMVKKCNVLNKDIEFIQTGDNYIPDGVHYGYGELGMLDYAFTNSRLMKNSAYMVKATGRLTFPGLPNLLDRLPEAFDFAVDCRDNSLFVRAPQVFVTTQLMIFSTRFYGEHLLGIKSDLTPDLRLIENLLYRKLILLRGYPGAILRWPVNVPPLGHASHWNKDYGSLKNAAINFLRAHCRRLFPKWWV